MGIKFDRCIEKKVIAGYHQCMLCWHTTDINRIGGVRNDYVYHNDDYGYIGICMDCAWKIGDSIALEQEYVNWRKTMEEKLWG